jgi:stage II sporulation protein D
MQTKKSLLTCISCVVYSFWLLIAISNPAGSTEPQNTVRVELFSTRRIQHICVSSQAKINELNTYIKNGSCIKPDHKHLKLSDNTTSLTNSLPADITLAHETQGKLCITVNNSQRCYTGTIEIKNNNKSLTIFNNTPIEDYILSVTGSELPPGWPEEAVKAQAIAIHTYLKYLQNKRLNIKDSTQNQSYRGIDGINPAYTKAVKTVQNIIIIDSQGQPIEALYHSTCGGKTLNNEDVFRGEPVSYLREVICPYDKDSNFYMAKYFSIKKDRLIEIAGHPDIEFVRKKNHDIQAIRAGNRLFSAYQFWLKLGKNLGWGAVPGVKYKINCHKNNCEIISRGAGHATGLCQWGARGMAEKGFHYEDILKYYYSNIRLHNNNNEYYSTK